MKRIRTKNALLFFALLITGNVAFSQLNVPADSIRLEKKLSILNKKIYFDFPANATASPRVADIMAADPNENRETRIIADWGKMRVVFFAQELFALSGKNIFADISKEVEPDFDFQRRVLTETDSVISVLSTPALFDTASGGILVNSLLVKTQDNTVCRIDAYVNPDAFASKDDFTRMTENIFRTISKGTRTVNLAAREETYTIPGSSNKFLFKLPKNYFITIDEKYDFSVFKLAKYKDLTDKTFSSITIYTGYHPSLFHKDYGFSDSSAVKVKSKFLQNDVDWLYFPDPPKNFYLREQAIPSDNIEKGLIVHIAMLTNKKDQVDELTKITGDIKLVK
ncbi:MAG: hypothetical protein ABIT05_00805 [Chitinophagaceae bacterium]